MRNDRIMQEGSTAVALAMVTPGYDQDPASGVADYANHQQDQAQFEADKRAVYKHPLFPLLALLFERCEQATQSSDGSMAESFNMDIQAFVQHQERDRKPFLTNDPEIDGLMIKAIQVLRIHLLELEKVQELCKDFCNRYITCLKSKMQSENLLRSDYGHHGSGHDGLAPSSGSNGSSPLQVLSSTGNDVEPGANGLRVSSGNDHHLNLHHHHHHHHQNSNSSSNSRGADVLSENGSRSGLEDLQSQPANQQLYRPPSARSSSSGGGAGGGTTQRSNSDYGGPLQEQLDDEQRTCSSPPDVLGSTPLSQIGAQHHQPPVNDMYLGQDVDPFADIPDRLYIEEASYWGLMALQDNNNARSTDFEFTGGNCHDKQPFLDITVAGSPSSMQSEDEDEVATAAGVGSLSGRSKGPKPKRGVLPKQATNIMRAWLFQHLVHPYPTEDEKRQISQETNLTMLQVNNWFINARRRILQPMLDGAGTATTDPSSGALQQQQRASKQQRSKQRSNSGGNSKQLQLQNQPASVWLSEDSGSETNGSSDNEANAYSDKRLGRDDEEDSEDGGIDIEEQKPYVH